MQPIHNAGKIERLKVKDMDLLEMMKKSRSIRKYQQKQIPRTDLDKIVEAGLHAPNAGGGQRSRIVAIHNVNLTGKIGKLNMMSFDRDKLLGSHVSDEQPSVIDDPKIKNGFYDAPTVCIIFAQEDFLFSVADAFCIAENMVLEAFSLGIDSCIVSRAEETFTTDYGKQLLQDWKVPETVLVKHFCNSTTYIFKNDIELHKEFDNHYMNVACHGCTVTAQQSSVLKKRSQYCILKGINISYAS